MTPQIPDPRATAVARSLVAHLYVVRPGSEVDELCEAISAALADAKRESLEEAITLAERFTCKGERTVPDSCGTAICQASRVLIDALRAKATEARHE